MELDSIHLFNFQCYKDSGKIPVHRMTIFIGENDSGKSCILRAIDIFLNNKPPTPDMFYTSNGQSETRCSINIYFKVNPDEKIPVEFLVDNIVSIKKDYSLNEDNQVLTNIFIKKYLFTINDLNSIKDLKAPRLKELCSEYDLEYTNVEDSKEILIKFTQDNFTSLEKDIDYCLCKWPDIVSLMPVFEYYDSSDYGNPQRFVESTLRNIYRSFFYEYDGRSESLRPEFASKISEIKEVLDQRIQESLRDKVASKIYKIKNIYGDYSIDLAGGFSLSDILVDYGTGPLSISRIGEGSKKRLFLAIIEWDKEIKIKEPHKMVIRGYDEPDASLHYNAQKEMYYNLRDLSNDVASQVQVIICTHSVSMIDRAPARIINHIKQQDGLSQVDYLKDDNERDIKQFLDSISEISGIKNSSLFFERCFLIVEGDTESNAIPVIYKKYLSRSLSEDGVVLINLEGNASWESFLKLLNKNKSKSTILFLDKDTQSDRSRKITLDKLKQINFDQEFLNNNVILAGNKEFEDLFSDELICRCINKNWPKIEGERWIAEDISKLRSKKKFSDSIIHMIGKYMYEHYGRNTKKPGKPEFGKMIAEIASYDEISRIKEITGLTEKISEIIR